MNTTKNAMLLVNKMWIRSYDLVVNPKTQKTEYIYRRSCVLYNPKQTPELFTLVVYSENGSETEQCEYTSLTFEYAKEIIRATAIDYSSEFFAVVASALPMETLTPKTRSLVRPNMLTLCHLPEHEKDVRLYETRLFIDSYYKTDECLRHFYFANFKGEKTTVKKTDDVRTSLNGAELLAYDLWESCKQYREEYNRQKTRSIFFTTDHNEKIEKINKKQQMLSAISATYPLRFRR